MGEVVKGEADDCKEHPGEDPEQIPSIRIRGRKSGRASDHRDSRGSYRCTSSTGGQHGGRNPAVCGDEYGSGNYGIGSRDSVNKVEC